ncbi:MAG TPA: ABC transporter permease [Lacunisphaera sp.]|jgi:predicted permease|nr:ABC transporter permease [Lacunisphaera sp.]
MMNWLAKIRFYVRSLIWRRSLDAQLTEEVRTHVAMATEANITRGMPPDEARFAALREFGNVAGIQEQAREERGWTGLENLVKDLRLGGASLVKSPGFTVTALITLALGIGINTSIFTGLNQLLFQSVPYPEREQLVQIWSTTPRWQYGTVSPGDFCDLRDQNTAFAHLSVYCLSNSGSIVLPGKTPMASVSMAVTYDYFPTLGISPALGRDFSPEDQTRRSPVVILSNAYWQMEFAGDPQVLGRSLRLNGTVATIVGVMPPVLDGAKMWGSPLALWYVDFVDINRQMRNISWYSLIARLKPGVSLSQAQTELNAIAIRSAHDYPETNKQRGFLVKSFSLRKEGDGNPNAVGLVVALAFTVLLIACANLANLQLARTTGRSREFGVRLALGATRGRLIQLVLAESVLLSLAGGALGLLVGRWSNTYFATVLDSPMPIDFRVLGFTFVVAALTGIAFGTVPAWLASQVDVSTSLKPGGPGATADRSRHRLRRAFVVAQLALALTLLTGAGYFIYGIQRIADRDLHWRPENVLTGNFELPYARYGDNPNIRHEVFADKFLAALRRLPGVDAVAVSAGTAAGRPGGGMMLQIEGKSAPTKGQEPFATRDFVTPGYFDTYGIHLLQGRNFTEHDRPGAPQVAVINQAMAENFWPGESPLGKRFNNGDPQHPDWFEVIGVVNNTSFGADLTGRFPPAHFYSAWAQYSFRFIWFSLHTVADPHLLSDGVRRALASVDPDVGITNMGTAQEMLTNSLSGLSLMRRVLLQMASLGLLLATVGIYGVIANLTVERTREIGIRMTLGAQSRDVVRLFLRNGVILSLLGAALGVVLSFILVRVLRSTVAIVPGNEAPWVVVVVAMFLTGVAIVACWLPARRATRVDPVVALRTE